MSTLPRLALEFAQRTLEATGQHLDFSLRSLALLDDLLDEWLHLAQVYGSERPHDLSEFTLPLLAYVGETIRQAFGGSWIERSGAPVLRLTDTTELDLAPYVRAVLSSQQPPAFARLVHALERALEDRGGG
ncbi:MAG: hypothetical protein NZL87_04080 [Thermomicrobium sp.]|nr:hypothetical protein [Thermomicrobium sp.]MCS7246434.1 hypothetical protein [Thermomicrobium sp.]MDW7982976.1 hypothetical protein [Thermomicrobium sp.]